MTVRTLKLVLFVVFLILGLFFCYQSLLINHFVVPVGGDSYFHIEIAQSYLSNGLLGMGHAYPPLFHITMGLISRLTGLSLPIVFAWATPVLLFGAAISMGVFARLWLKSWLGFVFVFGLSIFIALQPFQTWHDGGFPNVLASTIFLPLGLWFLHEATTQQKFALKPLLGYAILTLLVVISHHLTTGTYIVLSLGYLICLVLYSLITKRLIGINTKLIVAALVCAIPIGLFLLPGQPVIGLAKVIVVFSRTFPFIHSLVGLDNPNAIILLKDIPDSLGWIVGWMGLAGLIWLWQDRRQSIETKLLFISWVGILLIMSQLEMLRFPVRLARELGVPATLLAGYFLYSISQIKFNQGQRWAVGIFLSLLFLAGLNIKLTKINELPDLTEFTSNDQQAVAYLLANLAPNDCVIVVPQNRYYQFFLPASNKVLAYQLDLVTQKHLDKLEQVVDQAWVRQCRFIITERLPNWPNWTERFEKSGFTRVVGFEGLRRGTVIFTSSK